jgi:hypothetical protein
MDASIRTGKSPDSTPTRFNAKDKMGTAWTEPPPAGRKAREKIQDHAAAVCIRWLVMIARAWEQKLTHGIRGIGWQLVS